jgi:DNA-binding transcriptional regulator PaaX
MNEFMKRNADKVISRVKSHEAPKSIESMIFNYIKDHQEDHIDSVDLICARIAHPEETLRSLSRLIQSHFITKQYSGRRGYYKLNTNL